MVKERVKKGQPPFCPVTATIGMVGGKWKLVILYTLLSGKKRFNELQRLTGNPSARILTLQLRELEDDKLLNREVFDQIPPKVEYSLTNKGKSLNEVLELIAKWGNANG